MLNNDCIAYWVEQATIEAIKSNADYTVIGYDNGALVACLKSENGSNYWVTL